MDANETLRREVGATWFGVGLPADALDRLAALGHLRDVEPGTVLLTEGTPTPELVLLLHGRARVAEREPGREELTLMTVEAGDIVGWSVLLAPMPATATVTAIEASRVAAFPGAALRAQLAVDPVLSAAIHRQALDAVARRLLATRQQLMDMYRPGGPRHGGAA
ncbi:MAG: cyclic nucleotide-binding domain-containing protein [Chloroflexi bacterium]|nr:cyclic nucleotide-binding domain-containing protein [Chloroflexota bacterium]